MNWSTYQENIFENVRSTKANIAVSAVAGSGKTTTLVEIIDNLVGKTLFSAFNKHIAVELQSRIGDVAEAKTLHSAGMGLLSKTRRVKVDEKKYYGIIRDISKPHFHKTQIFKVSKLVKKLVGMTMNTLTTPENFELMLMNYGFLNEIIDLQKFLQLGSKEQLIATLKEIVYKTLDAGLEDFDKTGAIDFNDMIYIPVTKGLRGNYPNVLVDEAQDLNASQLQLVLALSNRRIISVADPNQSIMGFAGSLPDSYDRIVEKTKANILPLSVCYRCPTSHLELAQAIVPHIEPAPQAIRGEIHNIKTEEVIQLANHGDLIICRRNAPLVKLALKFIAQRRQARVRGRDFATDLMNLAETIAEYDTIVGRFLPGLVSNLEFYRIEKLQILANQEGSEAAIETLEDRCDCIETIILTSRANDIDELQQEISNLFSDEKTAIYLSSVHRAKGLEANNVFIIDYNKIRITYKGQQPWQAQQEAHLEYVALTRAKLKMYLVNDK